MQTHLRIHIYFVYHISHPGGRSYETFPINAREAETRRLTRFWNEGHTPGPVSAVYIPAESAGQFEFVEGGQTVERIPPLKVSSEFPNTLDLRASIM